MLHWQATEKGDIPSTEQSEEFKTADLELESEQLKQSITASRPHDSSSSGADTTLDSPSQSVKDKTVNLDRDASYNLMRSIAFSPVATQPGVSAAEEHLPSCQPTATSYENKGLASALSSCGEPCDTAMSSSPKSSLHQYILQDGDDDFVVIEREPIPGLLQMSSHNQEGGDTRHKSSCHDFVGDSSLKPNHVAKGSVDPGTGERSLTSKLQLEAHRNLDMYSRSVPGRAL